MLPDVPRGCVRGGFTPVFPLSAFQIKTCDGQLMFWVVNKMAVCAEGLILKDSERMQKFRDHM